MEPADISDIAINRYYFANIERSVNPDEFANG